MRNLSVIVLILTLFACSKKIPNEVVLKGQFANFSEKSVLLSYENHVDTVFVGEDGVFIKTLYLEGNTFAKLKVGEVGAKLFMMPGYDLEFSQDVNSLNQGIKFTNQNVCVNVNKYFVEKSELESQLKTDRKDYFSMNEEVFIAKTEDEYIKKGALLKHLVDNNKNIDSIFVMEEEAGLKYNYLTNYLSYESMHARYTNAREFKASEFLKDHLKNEELNNASLLKLVAYKNYLKKRTNQLSYVYYSEHPEYKERADGYFIAKLAMLEKLISDSEVLDYLVYEVTNQCISFGTKGNEKILATFKKLCENQKYIELVDKKLAEWEKLGAGMPAIDFEGQTIDGKTVSLSDLRGKSVYVDVWATWCGPCCKEIPYLHKLEKEYQGKNIIFLSVSVDKDVDKWKRMVKDKHMGGVQINVGQASSIRKDYLIRGIPRFMLFDSEGNIVDVNTPRPSRNIRDILDELKDL